MLELDECDQLLVTNPFADDRPTDLPSNHPSYDILPTLALHPSERHPLRSPPISSGRWHSAQGIPSEDVMESGLAGRLSLDGSFLGTAEEDHTTGRAAGEAPQSSSDIIHQVGPNDSFAGLALRYSVSIAAIRRANHLWPSDPIHLRTELFIPRGDTLRSKRKPARRSSTDAILYTPVEPLSDVSPDLVFPFVAARNMILSVFPARISLDSLSSKASASEDHELDELPTARVHKRSPVKNTFVGDGPELSILATPRTKQKLPSAGVALPSQISCSFPRQDYFGHVASLSGTRSRSVASLHTDSLNPRRPQPFSVLPVRTSQLEPEPVMELSVWRPHESHVT